MHLEPIAHYITASLERKLSVPETCQVKLHILLFLCNEVLEEVPIKTAYGPRYESIWDNNCLRVTSKKFKKGKLSEKTLQVLDEKLKRFGILDTWELQTSIFFLFNL